MWTLLLNNLILPLAVSTVKSYVKSSDTKKDDKVLEVVKTGATYLSESLNNTLSENTAKEVNNSQMRLMQKVR